MDREPELRPQQHGGALARGPNAEAIQRSAETQRRDKARREEVERVAYVNPSQVIRELFAESAAVTTALYRKQKNSRTDPSRNLIDASKETRALADRLLELIQAEGADAKTETWLAELEARFESLAPRMAEALGLREISLDASDFPESRGVLDGDGDLRRVPDPV